MRQFPVTVVIIGRLGENYISLQKLSDVILEKLVPDTKALFEIGVNH